MKKLMYKQGKIFVSMGYSGGNKNESNDNSNDNSHMGSM